jgi:ABC-type enterochelin transport system permease subunit
MVSLLTAIFTFFGDEYLLAAFLAFTGLLLLFVMIKKQIQLNKQLKKNKAFVPLLSFCYHPIISDLTSPT